MSASATSTADGTSAVIDGMMTVKKRLAQSRHGELTVEEAVNLMHMKQAACALRELSKPEEWSLARDRGGETMDTRDKEEHATEAMMAEDYNIKRKNPTREDNDEEIIQAMQVAQTLDPSLCQYETREGATETAVEEKQDKKPREQCDKNSRIVGRCMT